MKKQRLVIAATAALVVLSISVTAFAATKSQTGTVAISWRCDGSVFCDVTNRI